MKLLLIIVHLVFLVLEEIIMCLLVIVRWAGIARMILLIVINNAGLFVKNVKILLIFALNVNILVQVFLIVCVLVGYSMILLMINAVTVILDAQNVKIRKEIALFVSQVFKEVWLNLDVGVILVILIMELI